MRKKQNRTAHLVEDDDDEEDVEATVLSHSERQADNDRV